jgi:hypothetical protein
MKRKPFATTDVALGRQTLLNEFAIAESLRGILLKEQDHLKALGTALGIDPPDAGIAD